MTKIILAETVKALRDKKRHSQQRLADASRVGLATIKRVETARRGSYSAADHTAAAIAKALGVAVEDLAKPPHQEAAGDQVRRAPAQQKPLRRVIDTETALAFEMVERLYGIPVRSQLSMAPLFAVLLAEGSLARRKQLVAAVSENLLRLDTLGEGHLAFAHPNVLVDEAIAAEQNSIEQRDVFGEHVAEMAFEYGYDSDRNNPFADYLRVLAKEVDQSLIQLSDWLGRPGAGLPDYEVGSGLIDEITGGSSDAKYALQRRHVALKDIPEGLVGPAKQEERIAWIVSRIPEGELADRRASEAGLAEILDSLELGAVDPAPGSKGGARA